VYNKNMATTHNLYTVGNDAAIAVTPTATHAGMDITIQNVNSSGYLYVGASNVDSTNYGYRILPNHAISFELPGKSSLYVIASAPNMKAAVIRMGLEVGS
jgi:hypothetical protein